MLEEVLYLYDQQNDRLVAADLGRPTPRRHLNAALRATVNSIPRTRIEGAFVRREAEVLDKLRAALFEELRVVPEKALSEQVERLKPL